MKGSQVTIKDIARELNISPSTVSRALKDHPDISNDTKKAVTDLAAKWNYQPNTIAMGLRQNKTNTIGVIIPELVHFFFSTVISGIEDVAYSGGYSVIVSQSGENLEREALDIQTMFNHRVDGILMSVTKETDHFEHIGAIFDRGMPMVFFDRVIDSIACSKVVVDDFEGGYQATAHLIKQGYTRIAHLAGPEKLHIARQRLAGYKKALMDHGLGIDESMIFFEDFRGDESCAREITLEMLDKRNPPQAIFETS
ncbi:MAG: LacI family transcriptional regulator, partial [Cyclobacteriaceae bacterium]|nr:LacI family transcriptional regulator [Cyclobacteriaceae bacterium]